MLNQILPWAIIIIILLAILFSNIQVQIKDFTIESFEKIEKLFRQFLKAKNKTDKTQMLNNVFFEIKIKVMVFSKIPIICISLDNIKLKNILLKQDIKKSKKKTKNKRIQKLMEKIIRKIQIKQAKLILEFGVKEASVTAMILTVISITISAILPHIINEKNLKNISYKIEPTYLNKNVLFLQFGCIIKINTIHIIEVICKKEEIYE